MPAPLEAQAKVGEPDALLVHSRTDEAASLAPELQAILRLACAPESRLTLDRRGKELRISDGAKAQHAFDFAVLPNAAAPRWLLPLSNRACSFGGSKIIQPFARRAKIGKAGVQALIGLGGLRFVSDRLRLCTGQTTELVELLQRLSGSQDASFSVAFGTPGKFRKLTVLVVSPTGVPVAYVKLPMTEHASRRIAHEADILTTLAYTEIRDHVPQVLFNGRVNGMRALAVAPVPGHALPSRFVDSHWKLLQKFWNVRPVRRPGRELVSQVRAAFDQVDSQLSKDVAQIANEALDRAMTLLGSTSLSCGLSHGDFAPWNLRERGGKVVAFDWESAEWNVPIAWDIAHFDSQISTLLGRQNSYMEIARDIEGAEGAYLLYLVRSICDATTETGSASVQVINRERLLRQALSNL